MIYLDKRTLALPVPWHCPDCGCTKWRKGPDGGWAANVQCENGHAWWMGPTTVRRIPADAFGVAPGCSCTKE